MRQSWQDQALLILCQFQSLYSFSHDFWALKRKGGTGDSRTYLGVCWYYPFLKLVESHQVLSFFLWKCLPSPVSVHWSNIVFNHTLTISLGSLVVLQCLCIQYQLQPLFPKNFFFCICLVVYPQVSSIIQKSKTNLFFLIKTHIWSKKTLILSPS